MTKNFAHRGYSGKYPENTMLAFEKAAEAGVDGVELDVQLTKDGRCVVIHDETLDRTTDGAGLVADCTLEELRRLDASGPYAGRMGVNRIPTLDEYLAFACKLPLITNIELKTSLLQYEGIERKVADLIYRYGVEDRVIVSSFNHYSVLRMKKLAPQLKYGLLCGSWIVGAGRYTQSLGVQCYHPVYNSLVAEAVSEMQSHGIEINTYTVNTEDAVRDLAAKGVTAVIGNYPEMTARVLKECGQTH